MSDDIVRRLRGEYRVKITDGLGPAGGEEPNNPNEFVRTFQTPPIQHQAADEIERLRKILRQSGEREFDRVIELKEAADEIERLRARIAALEEALEQCVDELELELRGNYSPEVLRYPDMKRRLERDLASVVAARAALAKGETT